MVHFAKRYSLAFAVVLSVTFVVSSPAAAHPMGNFSINHYSGIRVEPSKVEILYIIDMAEIPTFQELRSNSISALPDDQSTQKYVARTAEGFRKGLSLSVDGSQVMLREVSHEVIFPPGAGGLPTMKIAMRLEGTPAARKSAAARRHLEYHDRNFPERAGWKEIVATASSGLHLASSSVPEKDRSDRLSNYTTNLLNSPPQFLDARIEVTQAPPTQARGDTTPSLSEPVLRANRQGTPKSAFTELIATQKMSLWFVLTAVLISATLGAFHALEPGHGKTVVAAYLVGSRGKARHAAMLGLIVTASHTGGVYVLGLITLYASRYIVPEHLYPWLGAASGLIIAVLGMVLFVRRLEGVDSHDHDHGGQPHSHGIFSPSHSHDNGPSQKTTPRPISRRELVALGITGGIIPCPAALVVLLGAMAVGRVGFGLLLIVAFSVGLAAALISTGLVVVFARRFMDRYQTDGPIITRWLPLASSGVITTVGIVIALRSLITTGLF
jgi:nickel/cobalt transporter (NicO) family protein